MAFIRGFQEFAEMENKLSLSESTELHNQLVSLNNVLNLSDTNFIYNPQASRIIPCLNSKLGYNKKENSLIASLLLVYFGDNLLSSLSWAKKDGESLKLLSWVSLTFLFF